MYPYRGRVGPPKKTPESVQCQKCLKRDKLSPMIQKLSSHTLTFTARHYTYECKAAPQERPYIPRPSRTQQLRNPKLLPKLTNAVPDHLQQKPGTADEILTKREAERARKHEREVEEDAKLPRSPPPRRRRSASYDSVSSISTQSPSPASKRGRSPPREPKRRGSRTPSPASRGRSPYSRSVSPRPRSKQANSRSPSPPPRTRPVYSRSPSPPPRETKEFYSRNRSPRSPSLQPSPPRRYRQPSQSPGRRIRSPFPKRSPSPRRDRRAAWRPGYERRADDRTYGGRNSYGRRSRSRSRSPPRRGERTWRNESADYRNRDERGRRDSPPPVPRQQSPERERSLSPFSKRLALTRALNRGHAM